MRIFNRLVVGLSFVAVSGMVSAGSTPPPMYSNSTFQNNDMECQGNVPLNDQGECTSNKTGTEASDDDAINKGGASTNMGQGGNNPASPGNKSKGGSKQKNTSTYGIETGGNAGGLGDNISVWTTGSWSDLTDEFLTTAARSTTKNGLVGFTSQLSDNLIVGAGVGLENTEIETLFNGGGVGIDGTTIVGVIGYLINDSLSFDGALGLTSLRIDQFRSSSATDPVFGGLAVGTPIVSKLDADRWFATVNLNNDWDYGDFIFTGRVGYSHVHVSYDSFTETDVPSTLTNAVASRDTNLGTGYLMTEMSYPNSTFVEPYFGITLSHDFVRNDLSVPTGLAAPEDRDTGVTFTLGGRVFTDEGISGFIEVAKEMGKDDLDTVAISASVQVDID